MRYMDIVGRFCDGMRIVMGRGTIVYCTQQGSVDIIVPAVQAIRCISCFLTDSIFSLAGASGHVYFLRLSPWCVFTVRLTLV